MGKESAEFGDELGGDDLVGIDPQNPFLAGSVEMNSSGLRESLPRVPLDCGSQLFGDGDRVVSASGVEDEPFRKLVDFGKAFGQVVCLVQAKNANGDGEFFKGSAHDDPEVLSLNAAEEELLNCDWSNASVRWPFQRLASMVFSLPLQMIVMEIMGWEADPGWESMAE